MTRTRTINPEKTTFRDRCILFKWTVEDAFRYLFIETSQENLTEIEDDLHRLRKLNPYER